MDGTGRSAKGLEGFLSTLGDQEILNPRLQDPYAQSHPLSRERLDTLRAHIQSSPYSDVKATADDQFSHALMVAKLYAFINPLQYTLRKYPETDQSFPARYARAIGYYRAADLKTALPLLDGLIAEMPRNPFLFELKGQMLFEHARPQEALQAYGEAVHLLPNEPLLLTELARVELEIGDPERLDQSIAHYRDVHRLKAGNAFTWRQLGIAYGRKGDIGMSSLALARSEYRRGQLSNAKFQAERASSLLKEGSSAHLQAQDILQAIEVTLARRAARKNEGPDEFFRYALLGLCTWTLGACSNTPPPPSMPGPEGQLTIMGNGTALNLDAPPRDWIISGGGEDRASAITSVNRDGVAALEIRSGPERVIVVRQVDAMLLATPFLSWTWNLSNHGAGIHPVRLVVGFKGGAPEDSETTNQGDGLPEHDRAIVLAWGDTALKRGTLSLPPPERPSKPPSTPSAAGAKTPADGGTTLSTCRTSIPKRGQTTIADTPASPSLALPPPLAPSPYADAYQTFC